MRNILLILNIILFSASTHIIAQSTITWTFEKTLTDVENTKYIRLCKIERGVDQGTIIMTYFKQGSGHPFGMRRSTDNGRNWTDEVLFVGGGSNTGNWQAGKFIYVNPAIINLDDGRLMLSYCKRTNNRNNPGQGGGEFSKVKDSGVAVRFSSDGGYNWGNETHIAYGGEYEPKAIQVPNDSNEDGHNDIYVYWSMAHIDLDGTTVDQASKLNQEGFSTGVVVSYDNGASWETFRDEVMGSDGESYALGARSIFRNFEEANDDDIDLDGSYDGGNVYYYSKGNMPTPFLLPDHRVGVVTECVGKTRSPWVNISQPNDWDWDEHKDKFWSQYDFAGFTSKDSVVDENYYLYDADELDNDKIYPTNRNRVFQPAVHLDGSGAPKWGGAPYADVMPNGEIVYAFNSSNKVRVFTADAYGENSALQDLPFPQGKSFFPCVIPISDTEILVAAHVKLDGTSTGGHTLVSIGQIDKDLEKPTVPQNLSTSIQGNSFLLNWDKSTDNIIVHKYLVSVNGELVKTVLWDNFTTLEGLNVSNSYVFSVRAVDYQGNVSDEIVLDLEEVVPPLASISPIPALNELHINLLHNGTTAIRILSVTGALLLETQLKSSGVLDISALPSGMFYIDMEQNGSRMTKRLMKM